MTALENIKNGLIDRILATQNEKLLQSIATIFDTTQEKELVTLTPEQIEMLAMSDDDIANSRIVSDEPLKASDPEWLK